MAREVGVSNKMSVMVHAMMEDIGESMKIKCHLSQFLKEHGIKLEELSRMTGIRMGTLSEMANTVRPIINLHHLLIIANVLGITDLEELYTIEISEYKQNELLHKRMHIDNLGVTEDMEALMHDNDLISEEVNLDYDKKKKAWKAEGMQPIPPVDFLEQQINSLKLPVQHSLYKKFKKITPTD
jgi:transcriptional regulator with XRE-family HTH domain